MKITRKTRLLSVFLAAAMLIGILPASVSALDLSMAVDTRVVDDHTMDDWKSLFGPDVPGTDYAGSIWTDKSVFKDASVFDGVSNPSITMKNAANHFLVALSAITSNKTIKGYSHIPTVTMLVLDVSASMSSAKISAMVSSANDAIKSLQDTNKNNMVGVVLYSGNSERGNSTASTATVLLPPRRYSHASDTFLVAGNNGSSVSVNRNVTYTEIVSGIEQTRTAPRTSKSVTGGTYIQNGIRLAMESLLDEDVPTKVESGFQAGTTYMPIMVLMSDGSPTAGTTSYANIGTSNMGNGTATSTNIGFVTQLSAAYAKAAVEQRFGRSASIFTLGVGMGSLNEDGDQIVGEANDDNIAMSVLDPANETTQAIRNLWNSFSLLNGTSGYLSLTGDRGVRPNAIFNGGVSYGAPSAELSASIRDRMNYVDRFFSAETAGEMGDAFDDIVDQIILQSLYYPTLVESGAHATDGYVTFVDELGPYMEVKHLHGLALGNRLFSGEEMAKQFANDGTLGTVDNPTEMGNEFVRSVRTRLGIDSLEEARSLISLAWAKGQLSYDSTTGAYSNYIGWYADGHNHYLGFANEGETTAPAGARFLIKSYGFLGTVVDGMKKSDMMYVSVRIMQDLVTGARTVNLSIPAALLPVVIYNIEVNAESIEEATEIKVTVDSAEPIRLIYEAGLVEGLNELTVKEMVDPSYAHINADGSYSFYTNDWSATPVDHTHPSFSDNAIAFFEPSLENERYYYVENSAVLVKSGSSYTAYDGAAAPSGEGYYRAYPVYTITDKVSGEATYTMHYEPISPDYLDEAILGEDGWYMPKGAIRYSQYEYNRTKTENRTGTYPSSHELTVVHDDTTSPLDYYAEVELGNNGKITLTPATGLKVEKKIDSTLSGTDYVYSFTVTRTDVANDNGMYRAVYRNAVGTEWYGTVTFENSVATIGLKADEAITIIDLKDGATYTVSETPHADYRVLSVNGDTAVNTASLTAEAGKIHTASFLNTLDTSGNLIISKQVTTELGGGYVPLDRVFTFSIQTQGIEVGKTFRTSRAGVFATVNADHTMTVDGANLTLLSGSAITIYELPKDALISVIEIITDSVMPSGFESVDPDQSGVITDGGNLVLTFENVYRPDPADVNVTVKGEKKLSGRDWLPTDSFTFILERLGASSWETVEEKRVTMATGAAFDFTAALKSEVWDDVGSYVYRIREVQGSIGGVTYTAVSATFTVNVGDANTDGKLDVVSVVGGATAAVAYSGGTWNVSTSFENVYAPTGGASVTVNVDKQVEDLSGSGLGREGYVFGLYDATGTTLLLTSAPTDANGKTSLDLTVTAAQAGQTLQYLVREIIPDPAKPGMSYSTAEYTVTVDVKDNLDGTVSAVIRQSGASSHNLTFTNVYEPDAVSVTLGGTKTLSGRDMIAGEFTFELYAADNHYGILSGQTPLTAVNAAAGQSAPFVFSALTFDEVGTYHYVLVEKVGSAGGMIYDRNTYRVEITVTDDGSGALQAAARVNGADYTSGNTSDIVFANLYSATGVTVRFGGVKTLNGRDLEAGEFSFLLKEGDTTVASARNAAGGAFSFALHYELSDLVGGSLVKTYTVTEENEGLGGVGYDSTVYTVTVTVTDNGDGTLSASVKVNGNDVSDLTAALPFDNDYAASPVDVIIGGGKTLIGRDLNPSEFTFRLVGEGKDLTASNAADGSFSFEKLTFDAVGTYTYTVTEVAGALGGVDYDDTVYTVTVTVTDDKEGKLVATTAVNGVSGAAIAFENTYAPSSASLILSGSKTLIGRDLKANEFTFRLYSANEQGVSGSLLDTATSALDGSFFFDEIEYDTTGVWYYLINEQSGHLGGVTYDSAKILVRVEVKDDGNGSLYTEVTTSYATAPTYAYDPSAVSIAFRNEYAPFGTARIGIGITKVLTDHAGAGLGLGGFRFGLYDSNDQLLSTTATDETGKASLSLSYGPGDVGKTFTYTLKELVPANPIHGMTYSPQTYTVKVTVTDNGDGTISATLDGSDEAIYEATFENVYKPDAVQVTLKGDKTLTGRDMLAGEFTFLLFEADEHFFVKAGTVAKTAVNDANGDFAFAPLSFDRAGTYYYVIEEQRGTAGGVIYDDRDHLVVITVRADESGKLVASVTVDGTENGPIDFANVYDTTSTLLRLSGLKKLNGRDLEGHEFTFELVDKDGKVVHTATNHMDGEFHFAALTFDTAGTYVYTVREKQENHGGVTWDDTVYTVTVTVTDQLDGTLKATYIVTGGNGADLIFENDYAAAPVDVILRGSKTLAGRDLAKNEFSFRLVGEGKDLTAANAQDGSFSFEKLTFDTVGTYTYTVSEINESLGGVTYDPTVYTVTVTVTDNGEGKLVAAVAVNGNMGGEILFQNRYRAEKAEIDLSGNKILGGREMRADEFTFLLYSANALGVKNVLIDSATNAANGAFAFDTLTYAEAGTYYYVVEEAAGHLGGVTYDSAKILVTVTVTDNGKGDLIPAVSYSYLQPPVGYAYDPDDVSLTFRNAYAPVGGDSVVIHIEKLLEDQAGAGLGLDGFRFTLTDTLAQMSAVTDKDGKTSFTLSYGPADAGKTFTYRVTEEVPASPILGMTYSSKVYELSVTVTDNGDGTISAELADGGKEITYSFTNVYDPAAVDVVVKGDKTLTGRPMVEGEFTFELYAADEHFHVPHGATPILTTNNADGSFVFDALSLDKVGTTYYVVEERHGDAGGVLYDQAKHTVKVTVTANADGSLAAKVEINGAEDGKIVFDNVYDTSHVIVHLHGEKTLTGRELLGHEFTFELKDADGNVVRSVTNHLDGTFAFGALTFDAPGVYVYTASERKDGIGGITYDSTIYTVTITVTDQLDGTLKAETVITDGGNQVEKIVFENSYAAKEATVTLSGDKSMVGRDLGSLLFTFRLVGEGEELTAVNNSEGVFSFDALTFTKVGTYTYTVTEDEGSLGGVTYDDTVYTVVITVTDNGEGQLVPTVTVNGVKDGALSFENHYATSALSVKIGGHKTLTGRGLSENEFAFLLYEADGSFTPAETPLMVERNDENGDFTFSLTFDEVGTYYYLIREDASDPLSGVSYDSTAYHVTVTVTDNGDGTLSAATVITDQDGSPAEKADYENLYQPDKTEIVLGGEKDLDGRDMNEGEFTFLLTELDGEGNPTDRVLKASNRADGGFSFEPITYEKAGVTCYLMTEDSSAALERVTYDDSVYLVTVTVTDDGLGALSCEAVYAKRTEAGDQAVEKVIFRNVYTPKPTDLPFEISVLKKVENLGDAVIGADGFRFTLSDAEGNAIASATSDEEGKASFALIYDEDDVGSTYTYTVTEVNTEVDGVTYDETVHTITVAVTLGEDNRLVATVTVDEQTVDAAQVTFVNTYEVYNPDTSDSLLGWVGVFTVTLAATAVLGNKRRGARR